MNAACRLPVAKRTAFFLCDIQERFRPLIHRYPSVIATAQKLIKAASILDVPLVVTEQYPKALGKIVSELDVSKAWIHEEKLGFSMVTDVVKAKCFQEAKMQSVVLFGIEVGFKCLFSVRLVLNRDITH